MAAKKTIEPVELEAVEPVEPVEAEPVTVEPAGPPAIVRASAGDSYASLAARYGLDVAELVARNGARPLRENVKIWLR